MMTAVSDTNALTRERRRPLRWLFAQFGDRMPKGLYARALIIIIAPIVLLQAIVALVFIQRHYDGVTAQMVGSIAGELTFAIEQVEAAPDVATARQLGLVAVPLGSSG